MNKKIREAVESLDKELREFSYIHGIYSMNHGKEWLLDFFKVKLIEIDRSASLNNVKPWAKTLAGILTRVKGTEFKYYSSKGIKNFLTVEDLKFLWERDRADLMLRPSIDRIDPDLHYNLENCRYLELSENCAVTWQKKRWMRSGEYKWCIVCGIKARKHYVIGMCEKCFGRSKTLKRRAEKQNQLNNQN